MERGGEQLRDEEKMGRQKERRKTRITRERHGEQDEDRKNKGKTKKKGEGE